MSPEVQKKRLLKMFVINGLCLAGGALALFGYIQTKAAWTLGAMVALFIAGFATQIWFIMGLAKTGRAQ